MENCGRFVKWFQRFGSSEDLSGRVNYSNTITAFYLFFACSLACERAFHGLSSGGAGEELSAGVREERGEG